MTFFIEIYGNYCITLYMVCAADSEKAIQLVNPTSSRHVAPEIVKSFPGHLLPIGKYVVISHHEVD